MMRVREKEREHSRKCYRPTGGWAMRTKGVSIVQVSGGQTSGPGRLTMGCLDHMRSSVSCLVTSGKSYRTSSGSKEKERLSMRIDRQYRDMTPDRKYCTKKVNKQEEKIVSFEQIV